VSYINVGNQIVIKRFESDNLRQFPFNVITPGIYSGGVLIANSNSTVSLRPIKVLIQDTDLDLYGITTTIAVNIPVSSATSYIILSYTTTKTSQKDYMDIKASASFTSRDIIVGKVLFSGTNITGIDYSERTLGNIGGVGSGTIDPFVLTSELISSDSANALTQGLDGKLYVPSALAGGVQSLTLATGETLLSLTGSGINPVIGSSSNLISATLKANSALQLADLPDVIDGGIF